MGVTLVFGRRLAASVRKMVLYLALTLEGKGWFGNSYVVTRELYDVTEVRQSTALSRSSYSSKFVGDHLLGEGLLIKNHLVILSLLHDRCGDWCHTFIAPIVGSACFPKITAKRSYDVCTAKMLRKGFFLSCLHHSTTNTNFTGILESCM